MFQFQAFFRSWNSNVIEISELKDNEMQCTTYLLSPFDGVLTVNMLQLFHTSTQPI